MASEGESKEEAFYGRSLRLLSDLDIPFLVGGAFAMQTYAGIVRDTKDLDVFCLPADHPKLVKHLGDHGYRTEITDANWLAKASSDEFLVDIIFGSHNLRCPVDLEWFDNKRETTLFGVDVALAPVEEILWSKAFVQDRDRFDGADVLHILRQKGSNLDWPRLLKRMAQDWEVLYAHLLNFRFVYPSERDAVPQWVMRDLGERVAVQLEVPASKERICRGPLFSRTQYQIDLEAWNYREK